MIVPMKSASRFSILALVAVIASPMPAALSADAPASVAPSDHAKESVRQRAARKDRVILRESGLAMVVEIYRVTGVGSMTVKPPPDGWPATVVIHLHGFPVLENLTVHTPAVVLTCDRIRPEGAPPRLVCHLGHEEVDAIRRERDHFEATLPAKLLEAEGPIDIQWVDQWR